VEWVARPRRPENRVWGHWHARSIVDGDWISITTPHGSVRAKARLNDGLADDVVAAQHGWWQACPELKLPGYDLLDSTGANINLAIGIEVVDPISGAAPNRSYPCEIEKIDKIQPISTGQDVRLPS
jgi:anaerobic selenocysteine-containing dehydrogenase